MRPEQHTDNEMPSPPYSAIMSLNPLTACDTLSLLAEKLTTRADWMLRLTEASLSMPIQCMKHMNE